MVLGECGRFPLSYIYFTKCIKYWCKLLQMSDTRYPKKCNKMLMLHDDIGRNNWVTNIKGLLFQYDYGYVWISQHLRHINMFVSSFKQRFKDCSTQNWSDNVSSSSRCDTCCTFKSLLNIKTYLFIDIPFYFRKYFALFRCTSHKLNIELGRRNGLERKDRICSFCFLNGNQLILEDEYHAFFICPTYVNIREIYLYNWYFSRAERFDFIQLMKSCNYKKFKQLTLFVTKLMQEIENM